MFSVDEKAVSGHSAPRLAVNYFYTFNAALSFLQRVNDHLPGNVITMSNVRLHHGSNMRSPSDSDSSVETEVTRPNRWQGPVSTWRTLTEDERTLAASLNSLRDRDLGIHLFNAHALKRTARERKEAEESGIKLELEPQYDTKGFVPPRSWTAWPMPPEDVPRPADRIGADDGEEKFTLQHKDVPWPSVELEEVLIATTLKFAKDKFRCRREETRAQSFVDPDFVVNDLEESRVKSKSTEYEAPPPSQPQHDADQSEGSTDIYIKESTAEASSIPLKPVVSTDDDRSRRLLRPSVRHILSKLDETLMALHHARKTCSRYGRGDTTSEDEGRATSVVSTASNETSHSGKRPRGRPRKFGSHSDGYDRGSSHSPELIRVKKSHRGRPQKNYERLQNETEEEYIVRIARIQKKPLPAFAPPLEQSKSRSPGSPSKFLAVPAKNLGEEWRRPRKRKFGLRDWSEVLGAAAIVGFDAAAVDRATKRCAALFGEGMIMNTTIEAPFSEPLDFSMTYQPEAIPNLDTESSSDSDVRQSSSDHSNIQVKKEPYIRNPKIQNFFCPISGCPRKAQGFRDLHHLKRHLKSIHRIDESEADDYIIPSDEEMDGAVHVDGFLTTLKPTKYKKQVKRAANKKRKASKEIDPATSEDHGEDRMEDAKNSKGRRKGKSRALNGSESDHDSDGEATHHSASSSSNDE